jgi:hypothetical protein
VGEPNLVGNMTMKLIHDMLIRDIGKATLLTGGLVVGKSLRETLGAVVEGIPKGFVDAVYGIMSGHEHLFERGKKKKGVEVMDCQLHVMGFTLE